MEPRNEWERLEWRELGADIVWHNEGRGIRWLAENQKGVSTLTRIEGFGATFGKEVRVEIDEPYLSRGTVEGFERFILSQTGRRGWPGVEIHCADCGDFVDRVSEEIYGHIGQNVLCDNCCRSLLNECQNG